MKMIKPKRLKNESIEEYNERASKLYYNNGYHIAEIAKKLKLNNVDVYNHVVHNGYRITTESERQEMIALYNDGASYSEIARIFNRSRSCVRERIKAPAKTSGKTGTTLNDRQLKKMKDLYESGMTVEAIAEKLKVSLYTVKYRLNHIDTYRHLPRVDEKELMRFIALFYKGKSYKEIAKACNRHPTTVSKHLKAAGYYK